MKAAHSFFIQPSTFQLIIIIFIIVLCAIDARTTVNKIFELITADQQPQREQAVSLPLLEDSSIHSTGAKEASMIVDNDTL